MRAPLARYDTYGTLAPGGCTTVELTVEVLPVDQHPGGADAYTNCRNLSHDGAFVDQGCVTHVIHN